MNKIVIILNLTLAILLANCQASAQKEFKKSYSPKETFSISTVSGNCLIKKSDNNQINVELKYTYPDDCFKYKIDESAEKLEIKEDFKGNCNGESDWIISVPENTKVEFNSASGDFIIGGISKNVSGNTASGNLKLDEITGEIDLNSASGDVILSKIKGTIKLNTVSGNVLLESLAAKSKITTASGDVIVKNSSEEITISVASGNVKIESSKSKINVNSASGDIILSAISGSLDLNTASGNIQASDIEIMDMSSLNAASGDIMVKLTQSPESDMTLSTASGNIGLDYNGNEVKGYFEFTARVDKGKIVSPIKFDKQEVVEIDGKKHDKKSFTKGSSSPKITLKTSSGTVELKK